MLPCQPGSITAEPVVLMMLAAMRWCVSQPEMRVVTRHVVSTERLRDRRSAKCTGTNGHSANGLSLEEASKWSIQFKATWILQCQIRSPYDTLLNCGLFVTKLCVNTSFSMRCTCPVYLLLIAFSNGTDCSNNLYYYVEIRVRRKQNHNNLRPKL